jgi:hypothetical protein
VSAFFNNYQQSRDIAIRISAAPEMRVDLGLDLPKGAAAAGVSHARREWDLSNPFRD